MAASARALHLAPARGPGRPPKPRGMLRRVLGFIASPLGLATTGAGVLGVAALRQRARAARAEAELLETLRRDRMAKDTP